MSQQHIGNKVAIIGAGISGLTMAMALKKANIDFVIYEGAKELKPVGAGIAMAGNAMQIYKYFQIDNKLEKSATRILEVELTDFNLNSLYVNNISYFEKYYGVKNIAIHRGELHRILVEEIGIENIVLNKRIQQIQQLDKGVYNLIMKDNSSYKHHLVIGADGLRSKVREFVNPQAQLRNANQLCYRGIVDFDLPGKFTNTSLEAWGSGKRFGFVKLNTNQVYWYFLCNLNKDNSKTTLLEHIKHCPDIVQDFIRATDSNKIFIDNIYDLKPMDKWFKDGVCLIGDAAHASTPNLGQGACQGVEDVYVISLLLEKYSLEQALQKYPSYRKSRAHRIVRQSYRLGKIAQIESSFFIKLRNAAFKRLPSYLANKQMHWILNINEYQKI